MFSNIIAIDEVERKPNFCLWLGRVGFPVYYGYLLENPHSCKDTKMATRLIFAGVCHGIVIYYGHG